ncbi:hypothetical protein K9M79_04915 [Candidatus Woesearchaeota archaeon]|nr:hypothetical protein [Candidatus Woesearchaeota archaeon]
MTEIPKIGKKISAFLRREEGKISRDKLMKVGILVAGTSVICASSVLASHSNGAGLQYTHTNSDTCIGQNDGVLEATHNHDVHGSHSSHGNHGSHGSHNSW